MELETLTYVLFAVVIAANFHSLMEPVNLKKQLVALQEMVAGKKEKPAGKINITPNPLLSVLIASFFIAFIASISFLIINAIEPDIKTSISIMIGIVVIVEMINTAGIDRVHAKISELKDPYRK
jgi:hypothetical protein